MVWRCAHKRLQELYMWQVEVRVVPRLSVGLVSAAACFSSVSESRLWQVGVRVGVRVGVERAVGVVAL